MFYLDIYNSKKTCRGVQIRNLSVKIGLNIIQHFEYIKILFLYKSLTKRIRYHACFIFVINILFSIKLQSQFFLDIFYIIYLYYFLIVRTFVQIITYASLFNIYLNLYKWKCVFLYIKISIKIMNPV